MSILGDTYSTRSLARYDDAELRKEFAALQRQLRMSATDKLLGRSSAGHGAIEEITCTAAGRALLDDANAAAQRTTLGLGSASVENYTAATSWTPSDGSGAGLTLTLGTATYIQIGKLMFATFDIQYPATVDGTSAKIAGLPAAAKNTANSQHPVIISLNSSGTAFTGIVNDNASTFQFATLAGGLITNAQVSGATIRGTAVYEAA